MKRLLSIILSIALLFASGNFYVKNVNAEDGWFTATVYDDSVADHWDQTDAETVGDGGGLWEYKLIQNEWKNKTGSYKDAGHIEGFKFNHEVYTNWSGFFLQSKDIKEDCDIDPFHIYNMTIKVTYSSSSYVNFWCQTVGGLGNYNIAASHKRIRSSSGEVSFTGTVCPGVDDDLCIKFGFGQNSSWQDATCQPGIMEITEVSFVDTGDTVDNTFKAKVAATGQENYDMTDVSQKGDQKGVWGYKLIQNEWNNKAGHYSKAEAIKNFVFKHEVYGYDGFFLKTKDLKSVCNLQNEHLYDVSIKVRYTSDNSDPNLQSTSMICKSEGSFGDYSIYEKNIAMNNSVGEYEITGTLCPTAGEELSLLFALGTRVDSNGDWLPSGCQVGDFIVTDFSIEDEGWTPVKNNKSSESSGQWGFFTLFDAENPDNGHWGKLSYKTVNGGQSISDTSILVRSRSGWLDAEASYAKLRDYASVRLNSGTQTKATIVLNSSKATTTIDGNTAYLRVSVGDEGKNFTLSQGQNTLVIDDFVYSDQYSRDISFELDMLEVGTELTVQSITLENSHTPDQDDPDDPSESETAPATIDVDGSDATWSDEFNGNELDSTKWTNQEGNKDYYGIGGTINWGNNELQNYKSDNVTVSDGKLNITAKKENTTVTDPVSGQQYNYKYTSGRICTRDKFSAGLGYVEAKIKLNKANGLWPAFWMLGEKSVVWPRNGEVDIMEQANSNNYYQSTVHYYNSTWNDNDETYTQLKNSMDFSQEHIYGVMRNGDTVAFYCDRQKIYEYEVPADKKSAPSSFASALNSDSYLILNLAVGGNFTGNVEPSASDLPKSMQVDYVRYYALEDSRDLQPDTWTNVGTWDLYNGKGQWCDFASMDYEVTGDNLGDTKMILTESPNSDSGDKEYGLGARLSNYADGKMDADEPYKVRVTLNSTKAGTIITNVEGHEYRIPVSAGNNTILTDEFEHNEYATLDDPTKNIKDVDFYLGMFPTDTEITISNVEFVKQQSEWTPVPNYDPDTAEGDAVYYNAGRLQLMAMFSPDNTLYGKMKYKVNGSGTNLSDTTVKLSSVSGWLNAHTANARLDDYNANLANKEYYTGQVTVWTDTTTGEDERGNPKKLRITVNGDVKVEEALEAGDNTIEIPKFKFNEEYPDIDFELDQLEQGSQFKVKSAEFTPAEGWVPVDNDSETTVGAWDLYARVYGAIGWWGSLSYKVIPGVTIPTNIGDTIIKARTVSGWKAYDTKATLYDYTYDKLEDGKTYAVKVTYSSSKATTVNAQGQDEKVVMNVNGNEFDFDLEACESINDLKRTSVGTFTYDENAGDDIVFYLDQVKEETELRIKYIEFVNVNENGTYDVEPYKSTDSYPEQSGKVFAGWYSDEECTTPYMESDGTAYPKFIDAKVLTAKRQWKLPDHDALRFVSSVDCLEYQKVGFEFSGNYGSKVIGNTTKEVTKVYKTIIAGEDTLKPSTAFENDDSQYFFTYTIRNMNGNTSSSWKVTPFYVTADGTKVMGTTKTFEYSPE